MTALPRPQRQADGFTLLEIIFALVIASLLGTMLFETMNTALRRSSEPVVMVRQGYDLMGIMERIQADYNYLLNDNAAASLGTLKTRVENGNNAANTPYYGNYTWQTKYISFNAAGNEKEPADTVDLNMLKVTITRADQTLTALFIR